MSGADLRVRGRGPLPAPGYPASELRHRLSDLSPTRRRKTPTARRIAQRRLVVWLTKWLLPVFALALLASVALWPEVARIKQQTLAGLRNVLQVEAESGRMVDPRYHGVDQRGRPYTVTASSALQNTPERIALTNPKGDLITESGTWLMARSQQGVYLQHQSLLDLSHDVWLYREDGTTLQTDAASVDLKSGAAASADKTHAEGPFGALDAQGFTLVDKGSVIQFLGPSHLVLNSDDSKK